MEGLSLECAESRREAEPADLCRGGSDDPPGDFTRHDFRVPLVVISSFPERGDVPYVTTDYTAWLEFVENASICNLCIASGNRELLLETRIQVS